MKRLFTALAALAIAATAHAQSRHHGYSPGYYTATSGDRVHRPMRAERQPAGATAKCRDGTWSFSEHHRGTCSYHGGVEQWLK